MLLCDHVGGTVVRVVVDHEDFCINMRKPGEFFFNRVEAAI